MGKRSRRLARITATSSCIDLQLESPVKCKNCIGKLNLVLGARMNKKKVGQSETFLKCEQPWSSDKHKSRWQRERSTFFRAWNQLVAQGYTAPSIYATEEKEPVRIVQEAERQYKKSRTEMTSIATTTLPLEVAAVLNVSEQVPAEPPTDAILVEC